MEKTIAQEYDARLDAINKMDVDEETKISMRTELVAWAEKNGFIVESFPWKAEKMDFKGGNSPFKEIVLKKIKDYLDGMVTKEVFYDFIEPFYTKYSAGDDNSLFHKHFVELVMDACLYYIDEPGLSVEEKETQFRKSLEEAYIVLQRDMNHE